MAISINQSLYKDEVFNEAFTSTDLPYYLENLSRDIEMMDSISERFAYFFYNSLINLSAKTNKSFEEISKIDMGFSNKVIFAKSRKSLMLFANDCYTNLKDHFNSGSVIEIPLFYCSFIFKFVGNKPFKLYKPSFIYDYVPSLFIEKSSDSAEQTFDDFETEFKSRYFNDLLVYIQTIYKSIVFIEENNLFSSTAKRLISESDKYVQDWSK